MTLQEFLSKFKTQDQIMSKDPNSFPKKLNDGIWVKNENKCRIELIGKYPGNQIPEKVDVFAWITYEALARNPERTFKEFLYYRVYRDHQ